MRLQKVVHSEMTEAKERRHALVALLLLVPIPSLGLMTVLYLLPTTGGRIIFALSKGWLLIMPALWTLWVDREFWRLPTWPRQGIGVGVWTGLAIFFSIVGGYALLGRHWVDVSHIRQIAESVGLASPKVYLGAALYWCTVNSVLEEYVWRWFVYRKCEVLLPMKSAVAASAIFFTIHHVIALHAYFDLRITVLGSLGVFVGGAIWSTCYLKFRSIWPGWVSHIWADLAVFGVGYHLFFVLA